MIYKIYNVSPGFAMHHEGLASLVAATAVIAGAVGLGDADPIVVADHAEGTAAGGRARARLAGHVKALAASLALDALKGRQSIRAGQRSCGKITASTKQHRSPMSVTSFQSPTV